MTVRLNPYLSFDDNAREAMTFYQSVFGGELSVDTFGESQQGTDGEADKIMHAQLENEDGFVLMASDTPEGMGFTPFSGTAISLSGDDDAKLRGYWEKLVDGGDVTMPLEVAPWGDAFGMCVDRFGISWMVNISSASANS